MDTTTTAAGNSPGRPVGAAAYTADDDAGDAATLSSDVLDLLAAIRDALDVPLSALTDADERAYQAVMRRRLSEVHIVLDVALDPQWIGTLDPAREAAYIRARTADTQITYTVWERPTDGGEQA